MTPADELRFWSKVDRSGPCWLWVASCRANGYGQINIEGKNRSAHRVAYELAVGPVPNGLLIDHACRVRACVRPEHLRLATAKQNGENREVTSSVSASGLRGVRWDKARKQWHVAVTHNYRTVNIGRFDSLEEASRAAIDARLALFTHNESDRNAA